MRSPSLYQEGKAIRVITAPFFLRQRWKRFEEGAEWTSKPAMILKTLLRSLKDGTHCFQEIAASPVALRDYLAEAAKTSLAESRFLDVLPGFVLEGERVPLIQERLALIAADIPGVNRRSSDG